MRIIILALIACQLYATDFTIVWNRQKDDRLGTHWNVCVYNNEDLPAQVRLFDIYYSASGRLGVVDVPGMKEGFYFKPRARTLRVLGRVGAIGAIIATNGAAAAIGTAIGFTTIIEPWVAGNQRSEVGLEEYWTQGAIIGEKDSKCSRVLTLRDPKGFVSFSYEFQRR